MIKTVGMIGRGAIGCLYGVMFQKHLDDDHMVYIVDANRKEKYEKNGLICNGKKTDFHYVTSVSEFKKVDLIFISTKYSGLHPSMELMKDFIDDHTIIVSCLNGISSEEILRKEFPNNKVIRTIVQGMDSTYLNDECVYTVLGELLFGCEFDEEQEAVNELVEFYSRMEIPYRLCENIVFDQWNKLMFNCGINQTCAAYFSTYGGCKHEGPLKESFLSAMKEVKMVANAKGIGLSDENIKGWIQVLNNLGNEGMPSMRQDIIAKRKTEKALFAGTILPYAKELHLECPTLQNLYDRITVIENEY